MNDEIKARYVAGEATDEERRQMENTLSTDAELRREIEDQLRMDRVLQVTMNSDEDKSAFVDSVMESVSDLNRDRNERPDTVRIDFRARMRVLLISGAVAAVATLFLGRWLIDRPTTVEPPDIAFITQVFGRGVIERAGMAPTEITRGTVLREGDSVRMTEGYLYARFYHGDGFELRDGFSGSVEAASATDRIRLASGGVRLWPERGPRPVEVLSDQAQVTTKDAYVLITTDGTESLIEKRIGQVEVRSTNTGEALTLADNQFTTVGAWAMGPATQIPDGP